MKLPFGEDEQEQARAETDLTLGIGSLLSIFFGVVLICGIFFGFGYSMGRRNIHPAAATPATTEKPSASPTAPLDDQSATTMKTPEAGADGSSAFPPDFKTPVPDEGRPHSTATSANDRATQRDVNAADSRKSAKNQNAIEQEAQSTSLAAVAPSHRVPASTKPRAGTMATAPDDTDAPIMPGHPIMVQIAAVSRQEDAEVLAGALRKRGFSPQVRSGMADKFYHVQVGPFTDKTQAETMKQHLLADGYNAIVK